jgi:hypothetical protein
MKLVLQAGKEAVVLVASRDETNLLTAPINEAILAVPDLGVLDTPARQ